MSISTVDPPSRRHRVRTYTCEPRAGLRTYRRANGRRKITLRSVADLPARLPMRFASEGRTVLKVGLSFLLTAAGQSWILARFPFQRQTPQQRECSVPTALLEYRTENRAGSLAGLNTPGFESREHGRALLHRQSTTRLSPSRRVTRSLSRYSSKGMANFLETWVQSLNSGTENCRPHCRASDWRRCASTSL